MKRYLIPIVTFIFLGGLLITSVTTGIPQSFWKIQNQKFDHIIIPFSKNNRVVPDSKMINISEKYHWIFYENKRYRYQISYPHGNVSSLEPNISPDLASTISIDTDPGKLNIRICAAENSKGISSKEFLELWTDISSPAHPTSLCGTFQKNVLEVSDTTINGVFGYQTKIFSYDHNELCYFLATSKTILALCIPEEDPTDTRWQERLRLHKEIVSTLSIGE